MLRSTLYIIILSVAFSGIILSLIVVLAENIEKYEAQEEYLEEYKQWARSVKDYSDYLKLQIDELGEKYDDLSDKYFETAQSKGELQKQYDQEVQFFEQKRKSFEKELQSQEKELQSQEKELQSQENKLQSQEIELQSQEKELVELERAQIEEMAKTNPLVGGLIDGQLRFYFEPVPYYAASKVKDGVTGFSNTLENYQFYTNVKFKRVYNPNDAHIQISWVKNYGSPVLGESIFKSVVKVGIGAENCYGDWQPFTAQTVMLIFWHELGHSMGFGHSNDPANIMYYKTDIKFQTDYDKTITLDEGESVTLQFCNAGKMYYQVVSEKQYNGFYVYVLPPETDSRNFIEYGIGKPYPDCSTEKKMLKYYNTCTVPNGAKLVIHNPDDFLNFDVIRVDTTIQDQSELKIPDIKWDFSDFEYDQTWLNQIWNMYH